MSPEQRDALLKILAAVPSGNVATYGQIAELAGISRGARQVGALLRTLPSDTRIPWHRIINSQGRISLPLPGANLQREKLEKEGIVLLHGKIDLMKYQWNP